MWSNAVDAAASTSRAPYAGSIWCTPSDEKPASETKETHSAATMAHVWSSYPKVLTKGVQRTELATYRRGGYE